MSKTLFVRYGDNGFWAYDVSSGVFLKHLVDEVERDPELRNAAPWLSECIGQWRIQAVLGDLGIHLDSTWTRAQRQLVCMLVENACRTLEKVDAITAQEAASWSVWEGKGVGTRGAASVPTAPSAELGRAVAALLDGSLADPPPGTWWCFGADGGRTTIARATP